MKLTKSIVIAKLPNTGLGNKMLTFARAYNFAKKHDLKLYTINWVGLSLGPIVRFERSKRYYNYFKQSEILTKLKIRLISFSRFQENEGAKYVPFNKYYVFKKISIRDDFFYEIRKNRMIFKRDFFNLLNEKIQNQIENSKSPDIAIHIRRGDFKNGSTLTDLSYFIKVLMFINTHSKCKLKTIIFSDGSDEELSDILSISGVARAIKQPDIVDLFQMSKSKVFIPSIGSTFSYWGAILNEGIIIRSDLEWHTNFLLEEEFNKKEFIFSQSNLELVDAISKLNFNG